jgi:hypothetical protein
MSTKITQTAGLEPTYSAREAAALLGRSYSWLDQLLRRGEFVGPDGSVLQPLRAASGYRYFTSEMLHDITTFCYWRRWCSFDDLKSTSLRLATDAHRDTGESEIPGPRGCLASSTHTRSGPQPVRSRACADFSSSSKPTV